jgi:hypothetical protein
MGRKFLTINLSTQSYRLFLDDIKCAHKKIRKCVPRIPSFHPKYDESATDSGLDQENELQF